MLVRLNTSGREDKESQKSTHAVVGQEIRNGSGDGSHGLPGVDLDDGPNAIVLQDHGIDTHRSPISLFVHRAKIGLQGLEIISTNKIGQKRRVGWLRACVRESVVEHELDAAKDDAAVGGKLTETRKVGRFLEKNFRDKFDPGASIKLPRQKLLQTRQSSLVAHQEVPFAGKAKRILDEEGTARERLRKVL